MKTSILSDIKGCFSNVLVLAKVEKYVYVGNQWLLEASGKALDQAQKASQLIQRAKLEQYCQTSKGEFEKYLRTGKAELDRYCLTSRAELEKYVHFSKQRLQETPERALAQAYNTALILKKIEDQHFSGKPVTSIASDYSDSVTAYFQLLSRKHLLTLQVRLLEFRASNWVVDIPNFSQVVLEADGAPSPILNKLQFIDEILARYQVQQNDLSTAAQESDFAAELKAEIPEPEIRNQLGQQWKVLGSLNLPFGKENHKATPHPVTTVDLEPQSESSSSRPTGNIINNIGLTSMLIAGGFAIGGTYSWALLSAHNAAANTTHYSNPDTDTERPSLNSRDNGDRELKSSLALMDIGGASGIISPSAPESLPPEGRSSSHRSTTLPTVHPHMPTANPQSSVPPVSRLDSATEFSKSQSNKSQSTKSVPVAAQPETPTPTPSTLSTLTQQRLLTSADLQGRSAWELTLLRNEIYARHGRQFIEPELQRHFKSQSWYHPRYAPGEFPVSLLSKIELNNAIMLRDYQQANGLL
jgi:hypothetical protein